MQEKIRDFRRSFFDDITMAIGGWRRLAENGIARV
jgi:hypothetical protein